jgi:hypothetical protein
MTCHYGQIFRDIDSFSSSSRSAFVQLHHKKCGRQIGVRLFQWESVAASIFGREVLYHHFARLPFEGCIADLVFLQIIYNNYKSILWYYFADVMINQPTPSVVQPPADVAPHCCPAPAQRYCGSACAFVVLFTKSRPGTESKVKSSPALTRARPTAISLK